MYRVRVFLVLLGIALSGCMNGGRDLELSRLLETTPTIIPVSTAHVPGQQYYAEFMGEFYYYPGHAYIAYGKVDETGKVLERHIIGFNAENPLLAFVGVSPGTMDSFAWDDVFTPQSKFGVVLEPQQYERMLDYFRRFKAEDRVWNVLADNCVSFVFGAAQVIGMKTPKGLPFIYPPAAINKLRSLNLGWAQTGTI